MPPPPPPPPGAPPPPAIVKKIAAPLSTGKVERKDLLKDIQRGKNLRPTQTNDRSAPVVGGKSSKAGASHSAAAAGQATAGGNGGGAPSGPLPGIGGLFAGGMPTLKKTKGGVSTGRTNEIDSATSGVPDKPLQGLRNANKFYNSTSSSLNSSPSLSPSPSPVGSTPTHAKNPQSAKTGAPPPPPSVSPAPPPATAKPSVPTSKPSLNPRPQTSSPGPVHPSSKPPPPPPNKGHTNLNRKVSKSFNQTIGHGPQGRPQLVGLDQRTSKDDTSIRNGQIGAPPPPPVRTVSQAQLNPARVPSRAPPPPPSHKRPSQPPPPPPLQPPPPPGIQPPNKALPPPPPTQPQSFHSGGDPPTPPTRRESIYRTGPSSSGYNSSTSSTGESFESRFSSRFRGIQYLPPPEPFSGSQKTYPSKNTLPVRHGSQIKRTPAPPPPPGKHVPSSAPPPPPFKSEALAPPGKPPLPPLQRQWQTTSSGML